MAEQTITINGVAFVCTVDPNNGYYTKIVVPAVRDPSSAEGYPFTVEIDPFYNIRAVYSLYDSLLQMGLISTPTPSGTNNKNAT